MKAAPKAKSSRHPLKIAIFSDAYLDLTGGITSSINAQKAALEANGHTVEVFSTGYPRSRAKIAKLAQQNIFLAPSCRLFFRGLTPVSRRPQLIRAWLLTHHPELRDYDVFYVHYEAGLSITALKLARELKIPSVQVMHGREDMGEANIIPLGFRTLIAIILNLAHSRYLPHRLRIPRDSYLADTLAKTQMWELMVAHANFPDLVLTPSHHFRQKLHHYGVKTDIKILPNGLADHNFPDHVTAKSLKPGEPLKLIWHSRLSAEKRILPFLKALTMVDFPYQFDVFGSGPDIARAIAFARAHRLNATFHGTVSFAELEPYLRRAHLDILSSYNFDNYAMTLVEAEAFATPAFICDPDLQEIVPEDSFVLSQDETPAAMANALSDLYRHPSRLAKMSQILLKARSEVLISKRIKILENILQNLR